MKQKLLETIDEFRKAVEQDDVPTLIKMYDKFGIDSRKTTILDDIIRNLMIEDIKSAVKRRKTGLLKVIRIGVYHEPTADFYKIEEGKLIRNGSPAKWTSIGKLYQAYKHIHKIKN